MADPGESFPTSVRGDRGILVCFAALCLLAIFFITLFLPETTGYSGEEITRLFDQPARQAIPASELDT